MKIRKFKINYQELALNLIHYTYYLILNKLKFIKTHFFRYALSNAMAAGEYFIYILYIFI